MERGTFLWVRFSSKCSTALCITAADVGRMNPAEGHIYVYWFGDGRISAVPLKDVYPFAPKFIEMHSLQSNDLGPRWKTGVLQAIQCYSELSADTTYEEALHVAYSTYDLPNHKIKIFVPFRVSVELSKLLLIQWCHSNQRKYTVSLLHHVIQNRNNVEICMSCYTKNICDKHPIVKGSLCERCQEKLYHTIYGMKGLKYCYCIICGSNLKLTPCKMKHCKRFYCYECITNLKISLTDNWACIICKPSQPCITKVRRNWQLKILQFFAPNALLKEVPLIICSHYDILVLFDGVSRVLQVFWPHEQVMTFENHQNMLGSAPLKEIDFQYLKAHFVSAITSKNTVINKMNQREVTIDKILQYNKLKLLLGGTSYPSIGAKRHSGGFQAKLFWEFLRIYHIMKVDANMKFKFVFELNATVTKLFVDVVTRYLKREPFIIPVPGREYRLVWTNIEFWPKN